ncbi:secretoglobin family 2B member 2 [Theropithecus gelada]|uniref:secretoglobin family 2B member 2 n=1 Tax=Theropithecus gelada TaxID=9565 RepID=UPI000DC1BB6C|nr:secretoglobin family 2B member 2 [Theropithecus gelada]
MPSADTCLPRHRVTCACTLGPAGSQQCSACSQSQCPERTENVTTPNPSHCMLSPVPDTLPPQQHGPGLKVSLQTCPDHIHTHTHTHTHARIYTRGVSLVQIYIKLTHRQIPCLCLLGPDSAVMRVTSAPCALLLALICSVQLGDACLAIDKLLGNVVFDVSQDLLKEELAPYNPSPLTEESFLKIQQCFANVSVKERFAHSFVITKILQSPDCVDAS